MIKLFDVENGKVIPSIHCKTIKWLRVIEEKFPNSYLRIYEFIFYMTCPNEEQNPYFNILPDEREVVLIDDLGIDFSLEEDEIIQGLAKAMKMYETPTVRSHNSIVKLLDKMCTYMETASITAGRDGNINSLLRMAKDFDEIRQSYKGIAKDLLEEQKTLTRGGQMLAYDQSEK